MSLSVKLKSNEEESLEKFNKLQTGQDVADLLEIPYGQLLYILYKIPEQNRYSSFEIPKKSGGERSISKPMASIAILQQKIVPFLHSKYRVKSAVHGFVCEKSIVSNAFQHKRQRYVLNVDLKDFYDSINFGRVRGLFLSHPFKFGETAASLLAHLCCFKNKLPQGACTSPVISNFISADLDKRLTSLAQKYHCKYTRYADDITFSYSKKNFPRTLAYFKSQSFIPSETSIGNVLEDTITAAGFTVNYKKVRLQIRNMRQEVTGLTVNEFPNVRRKFIRQLRAMIHAWDEHGVVAAEKEHLERYSDKAYKGPEEDLDGSYYKSVVYGKLSFLKMVRGSEDAIVSKLAAKVGQLDSEAPGYIQEIMMNSELFDVFIGHASEDKKDVAEPIFQACMDAGVKCFLDQENIKWGDSITQKINQALSKSRFFLAIVSESSINKAWPSRELNSAIARDISGEQKVLPLIVGNPTKVLRELPLLQDKLYLIWEKDPVQVAERINELKS